MLVATVSLGFIAPMATQASDFNIEGMNSYSEKLHSIQLGDPFVWAFFV